MTGYKEVLRMFRNIINGQATDDDINTMNLVINEYKERDEILFTNEKPVIEKDKILEQKRPMAYSTYNPRQHTTKLILDAITKSRTGQMNRRELLKYTELRESILDSTLTRLSKNGTVKKEVTELGAKYRLPS